MRKPWVSRMGSSIPSCIERIVWFLNACARHKFTELFEGCSTMVRSTARRRRWITTVRVRVARGQCRLRKTQFLVTSCAAVHALVIETAYPSFLRLGHGYFQFSKTSHGIPKCSTNNGCPMRLANPRIANNLAYGTDRISA